MAKETTKSKAPSTLDEALVIISELEALRETDKKALEEETKKADELTKKVQELETKVNDSAKAIESKDEVIKELEACCKEKDGFIDELNETIKKIDVKVDSGDANPSVEIEGTTYSITAGIKHQNVKYSAKDLSENTELCAELLQIKGQTILVELKK